ncbi:MULTISPECIES: NAD(+) kinase [Prochlorococcus]|uniref:NAD(+) kinase n=1 Tax=Prochlorococcus TaxID=1218 RepID=UPI000533B15B|nr:MULTISPECIES: NAD(+) kinase [Prochlorococcus]KGG13217.1 NAD kinase [Prochlorococcus sp. MIT 0601]
MQLDLVWIIYKSNSNLAQEESSNCSEKLQSIGIKVKTFESNLASNSLADSLSSENNLPNLAIVLGGDGTVLAASRYLALNQIPILSFNVGGNLGFLTHDKTLLNSENLWERISSDHFALDCRMMLQASIELVSSNIKKSVKQDFWALNDFYFRSYRDEISPTCSLELAIDGEAVDIYRGDGLILSSPTGSTAYAMASGGPILHPDIEGIVVSAICPMSLSSRPIVIPSGSKLVIKPLGDTTQKVKLWQDGMSSSLMHPGDQCLIKRARHNAHFLILDQRASYYRTLTQKLHWAGSFSN